MINDIKRDAETRMKKSVESLRQDLTRLRTGRASTALVEHLKVSYYGSDMPLTQVANVTVSDARSLTITPWEKTMVGPVEKAILASDLGLTPNTAGTTIRINMPALTEERRRELTKVVHQEGENAKIAIRNIRRDANQQAKDLLKEKEISEDEERRSDAEIQKITDQAIKAVDDVVKAKAPRTLQRDDDLTEDLDIDSLDFIDLVSVLEDRYTADDLDAVIDRIPDLVTVGDLVDAFLALAPSQ